MSNSVSIMSTENKNLGGSFNDFLKEEGILEDCTKTAMERVLAWQTEQKTKGISNEISSKDKENRI